MVATRRSRCFSPLPYDESSVRRPSLPADSLKYLFRIKRNRWILEILRDCLPAIQQILEILDAFKKTIKFFRFDQYRGRLAVGQNEQRPVAKAIQIRGQFRSQFGNSGGSWLGSKRCGGVREN